MGNYLPTSLSETLTIFESPNYKNCKVILHGLDTSGKTTVLYKLKQPTSGGREIIHVTPTIGFNVETLQIYGYELVAWDIGGRSKIRPLFRHYYPGTDALIFVVDSNDRHRFEQARDELHQLLEEELLQEIPVLVFCNKQDLTDAASLDDIRKKLQIDKAVRSGRQIAVVGCCAVSGLGLKQGMDELRLMLEDPFYKVDSGCCGSTIETESSSSEEGSLTTVNFDNELDYDPVNDNRTLELFEPIKRGTECPFAKGAKLWGAKDIVSLKKKSDPTATTTTTITGREEQAENLAITLEVLSLKSDPTMTSIEEQAKEIAIALEEFTHQSKSGEKLDGFCIALDLPDEVSAADGREKLGKCIRRVLTAIADEDPSGENCMRVNCISKSGHRFRFNKSDFLVTSFGPFYAEMSSRNAFGSDHAFVLLQSELSFERQTKDETAMMTNWNDPVTIQDRTLFSSRDNSRLYNVPSTTNYPMSEQIVKPLTEDDFTTRIMKWWESS